MKPIKTSLLLFFLSYSANGLCQFSDFNRDSLTKNFIVRLERTGIDTICAYQEYCIGCTHRFSTDENCIPKSSYYIFWISKGKKFLNKIDNCYTYSDVSIEDDSIWSFLFANKESIISQEIKPFEYIRIKNDKKDTSNITIDHSFRQRIKVILGTIDIEKNINDFDLEKEFSPSLSNINYEFNTNSFIKQLQVRLALEVRKYEQKIVDSKTKR